MIFKRSALVAFAALPLFALPAIAGAMRPAADAPAPSGGVVQLAQAQRLLPGAAPQGPRGRPQVPTTNTRKMAGPKGRPTPRGGKNEKIRKHEMIQLSDGRWISGN